MEFHVAHLVVLSPAIASVIIGAMANYSAAARAVTAVLRVREYVEAMRDFVVNFGFLGSTAGFFFGVNTDSNQAFLAGGLAFVFACFLARTLSKLLIEISKEEASKSHRRIAGTVRSIVRSEMSAGFRCRCGPVDNVAQAHKLEVL